MFQGPFGPQAWKIWLPLIFVGVQICLLNIFQTKIGISQHFQGVSYNFAGRHQLLRATGRRAHLILTLGFTHFYLAFFFFFQQLHERQESQGKTELLMSALMAMQDKTAKLETSLSAETRLKLDLFSALGDARRQLEIYQGKFYRCKRAIWSHHPRPFVSPSGGTTGGGGHGRDFPLLNIFFPPSSQIINASFER